MTFLAEEKYNQTFLGVCFLRIREKILSQIPYSWSFSSSNLKLSIITALFSFAIPAFFSHVLVIWSISVNVAVAVFVAFLLLLLAVDNAAAVSDLVVLSL